MRRPSDISNGPPLDGERQRSVTPPSASRLSQNGGKRSLLKSSFKNSTNNVGGVNSGSAVGSELIASQLRTNTERQE